MKLTNKQNLPQPIVDAIASFTHDRGDAQMSVTELLDPPRKVALTKQHEDELTEDVSDLIYALQGNTIHEILKRAEKLMPVEERLFMEVGGWNISGRFDRLALIDGGNGAGKLQDWKNGSVYEVMDGLRAERIQQLNCYTALARANGYRIDKLEAVFILRDWSKPRARRESRFPQRQVVVLDVPLWSEEEALAFLKRRVKVHQATGLGSTLPECTDEERWQDPVKWAVTKRGGKKASRLLDSEDEAKRWIDVGGTVGAQYDITQRVSESKRCIDYCIVAEFCDQYQAILGRERTAGEAEASCEALNGVTS